MKHLQIFQSPVLLNFFDFHLVGSPVIQQLRKLEDLAGIFRDEEAFSAMDLEQTAYTVQACFRWKPNVVSVGVTRGFDRNHVRFWVEPCMVLSETTPGFYCIQFQPETFLNPASRSADKIRLPGMWFTLALLMKLEETFFSSVSTLWLWTVISVPFYKTGIKKQIIFYSFSSIYLSMNPE